MNTQAENQPTAADLAAENAALKAQVAQRESDERKILKAMELGLTREQATKALQNQKFYDQRKAALGGNIQVSTT